MDDDTLEALRRLAGNPRKHASFFHWHERSADGKGIVELDIVSELLHSMRTAGADEFREPRRSADQWPDCWVLNHTGADVPVEVTELVDFSALPSGPARAWRPSDICTRIQERIDEKSVRSINPTGAPTSVLVMHTDEPYLEPENVGSAFAVGLPAFKSPTIARAFLLFSYRRGGYPYLEIPLAPPA